MRVTAIWRHPVKSMAGEQCVAADLDADGLVGDRAYAVLDLSTGRVASASYRARRWAGLLGWRATYPAEPRSGGGQEPAELHPPTGASLRTDAPGINAALSGSLGHPVRLLGLPQATAAVMYGSAPPGSFMDIGRLHVLSRASLERLGDLAPGTDFDARRFRPNLVIDTGGPGFTEDAWVGRSLSIGDEVRLRVTGPCPRCVVTTHRQAGLPRDPAVLRTVAQANGASVGVYAEVVVSGRVQVDDLVRLLG